MALYIRSDDLPFSQSRRYDFLSDGGLALNGDFALVPSASLQLVNTKVAQKAERVESVKRG